MFIDEANIKVKAGNGGHGCVSFRREKFIPKGGPDGGDGGKGGDIILKASSMKNTLVEFNYKNIFKAKNGMGGSGSNKTGKSGSDIIIKLPVGTIVIDRNTNLKLKDLSTNGEEIIVVKGGRGGRGNARFASSTNQTPRNAEKGIEGESRQLYLELKLLADVGLVGLPNAGKSTLLSRLSAARPKIAEYPFTTLNPMLGIVEADELRTFVMVDIPGLIEGAHKGTGLGITFLKHIERTKVLVYLIDIAPISGPTPSEALKILKKETGSYGKSLASKDYLVAANKMDMPDSEENLKRFINESGEEDIIPISAVTGKGLNKLIQKMLSKLDSEGIRSNER